MPRKIPSAIRAAARIAAVFGMLFPASGLDAQGQAARTGSPAWFNAMNAQRGGTGGGVGSGAQGAGTATGTAANNPAGAASGVAQSMANFRQAAQSIAAAMAKQQQAAQPATPPRVPDGLTPGGLWVDPAAVSANPGLWSGAAAPKAAQTTGTQAAGTSASGSRTTVTVAQTAPAADLTWNSFNIGPNTTLNFTQGASSWTVLNRVNDPRQSPAQIFGAINAPGLVLVLDPNGILFGPGSQVNVGGLAASSANLASSAFSGILSTQTAAGAYLPAFTGATAPIWVQAGASIATSAASGASAGGGYVLLMGQTVRNDGLISTPGGQTILAAGTDFILRPGYSPTGNSTSTTLGLEVAPSGPGVAVNSGLIQSTTGDITLTGETILQAGVLLSTTTVSQRGTIHLASNNADAAASIVFAPTSLTAIQPQDDGETATNSARANLIAQSAANNVLRNGAGILSNQTRLPDQQYQSRIEIVSGGTIEFQNGSLNLSTGGQIAVSAAGRIMADTGSVLSAAGSLSTVLPASANSLQIDVQGYDLRDAPANRDTGLLASKTVNVAIGDLVSIGTQGYEYTPGGLLEVSGYVNAVGHSIGEWTSLGGSISLAANQVVTAPGAVFNLAGGQVAYAAGTTANTWLTTASGQVYNINNAPANLTYTGVYAGDTVSQPRWGISATYVSPLVAPATTVQQAYTVGRDGGTLTINAPTAVLEGSIAAGVSPGAFQTTSARPAGADPFTLSQTVVPMPATLVIGPALLGTATPVVANTDVKIAADVAPVAGSLSIGTPLPADRTNTTWIAAPVLNQAGLGGLTIVTQGAIEIDAPLTLADGASVSLLSPAVRVLSQLTARGGTVTIGNESATWFPGSSPFVEPTAAGVSAYVALGAQGAIDTRGVFTNIGAQPDATAGEAFANGGSVTIDSSGPVSMAPGSLIDASAGGVVLANGSVRGAVGGAISLTAFDPADVNAPSSSGLVSIAGTLRSYGSGALGCTACTGGALTLVVPQISVGGPPSQNSGTVTLAPEFFASGFSSYNLTGLNGVSVADGTRVTLVQPVEQFTAATLLAPSGTDPAAAFTLVTPPLYTPNQSTAVMAQRPGASLALTAGTALNTTGTAGISIGGGAAITVDPGQSIGLTAPGQITVNGTLTAPGGTISIVNTDADASGLLATNYSIVPAGLSIWVGGSAVLDVSAHAATALDDSGRAFGTVRNGGKIQIGGPGGQDANGYPVSTNAYVSIQTGAVLNASGTSATIDLEAGQALTANAPGAAMGQNVLVASAGGTIAIDSAAGIGLGGQMIARSGGAGAQGGTLAVNLVTPDYTVPAYSPSGSNSTSVPATPFYSAPRELTIGSDPVASSGLSAPGAAFPDSVFGRAALSAARIASGGFDVLNLSSGDAILFDGTVNLAAGRSIALSTGILGDTGTAGQVTVNAPYVTLSGTGTALRSGLTFQQAGVNKWTPSARATTAVLAVQAANIDISGNTYLGGNNPIESTACSGATCPVADLAGFASATLASSGDIRFLTSTSPYTTLTTPGNLTLTAGQIYPIAGANALVTAGFSYDTKTGAASFDGTLTIGAAPGPTPAPPLTAGGTIELRAGTIVQGGVLRAPEGQIALGSVGVLGNASPNLLPQASAAQVELLPGSITSVSMNGLTIPFGGTSDDTTYTLKGASVPRLVPQIVLTAGEIVTQPGSVIDVSGGGTLAGAGFVAGRGGSSDILQQPLLSLTAAGKVTQPSSSSNLVYAILPGFTGSAAPPAAPATAFTGPVPAAGQQITIGAGVPGLAAGSYTLLPGSDALLPGAFRVELATTNNAVLPGALNLGNGSWVVNGYQGVANTSILSTRPIQVTVTPGAAVRLDAQYDETSYASFQTAQAALFKTPRDQLVLPADAKTLEFDVPAAGTTAGLAVQIAGTIAAAPAAGGLGGLTELTSNAPIEVLADGASPGLGQVSVLGSQLSAVNADTLVVGGTVPNIDVVTNFSASASSVTVRSGAVLSADQVFLVGAPAPRVVGSGGVTVEPGATISTVQAGTPSLTAANGVTYGNNNGTVLAVSNGALSFAPVSGGGPISIGTCATQSCPGPAALLSRGTIATETAGQVSFDPGTQLGASTIALGATTVNLGTPPGGTSGLTLTPAFIQALVTGNPAAGVPGLSQLVLTAAQSIDFYGDFVLGGGGQPVLRSLQLNTPAIFGGPGVTASVNTGTFVWNGVLASNGTAPPGQWTQGGGTGTSGLSINASTIVLGYGPSDVPQNQTGLDRLILGFDSVTLGATQSIVTANRGSLSVYRTGTQDSTGKLASGSGGALTLSTPLLTGAAASVFSIAAGGDLTIAAPASAPAAGTGAQGAALTLTAANIVDNTTISMPSGALTMNAAGSIGLGAASSINLAGLTTTLFDQTISGWGGTAILQAGTGGIAQAAGGTIDVSAGAANAGSVTLIAPGTVALAGSLKGGAGAGFAGGTFSVRVGALGSADPSTEFAALNSQLDRGGFSGGRSFELLTGDLTIGAGTAIAAGTVSVATDSGALTVAGTIDASGATPGTIALAAGGNLTLAASAVLDAHGTVARVDSLGQSIDSENTASVALTSARGTIAVAPGAAIDVSAPAGVSCALGACGQVAFNAPRLGVTASGLDTAGDIAISVPAGVAIKGAGNIVVAGVQAYTAPVVSGTPTVTQTWFNQTPGADATTFMNLAVDASGALNPVLAGKLAGLTGANLLPALHVQPGIEIDSPSQAKGVTVATDLDLSGLRFRPIAAPGRNAGLTEPGELTIRAGDGLTILGSINDGFSGAPAATAIVPGGTAAAPYTFWELATPLAPNADGTLARSWSLTLAAGADLGAANTQTVLPSDALASAAPVSIQAFGSAQTDGPGSIQLYAPHSQPVTTAVGATTATDPTQSSLPGWSVIRTGTGSLSIAAGGSVDELSPFAIYTAGAVSSLAAGTSFNLPRGTSATAAALNVALKPLSQGAQPVPAGTILTDPSRNQFVTTKAVTFRGFNSLTVTVTALSASYNDPAGTVLTFTCGTSPCSFASSVTASAPNGLSSNGTVLGTGGQATVAGGGTLESLISGYQAWYPAGGGNLTISAGGDILGYLTPPTGTAVQTLLPPDAVGNWLWRQGGNGASTAWWINYGTLAIPLGSSGNALSQTPQLTGFTGIGTLGGGNVTLTAGGDIGAKSAITSPSGVYAVTQALDVTVASTGRVAADTGTIMETGGGLLTIRAGGALNGGGTSAGNNQANGTLTDTRGAISVLAGSVGQIALTYGQANYNQGTFTGDPLSVAPNVAVEATAQGGPIVVVGDGTAGIEARGDLVLGGAGDATRLPVQNLTPANVTSGVGSGLAWFTLWQNGSAIDLDSAGGNLVVSTQAAVAAQGGATAQLNAIATDNRFVYPPSLTGISASGSIYGGTLVPSGSAGGNPSSIELAPSPVGQLRLIAAGSILGDSQAANGALPQSFDISGASASNLPTPSNPAWIAAGSANSGNRTANIGANPLSLFAFEADTASGTLHASDPTPALIYAGGDIVDFRYGETLCFQGTGCPNTTASLSISPSVWYVSGKSVRMEAGGNIVEPGTIYLDLPAAGGSVASAVLGQPNPDAGGNYNSTSGLIVNNNPSDVSVVQAGGEILYANLAVAGPGQLYVQAGGSVYQGNLGVIQSLGPIEAGTITGGAARTGGAGITVLAGAGGAAPDWTGFAQTYLAPTAGYDPALLTYLQTDFGYTGDATGAQAYFDALPQVQKDAFLSQIYFAELKASGREFTDPTSARYKSYARGRAAIAALFPSAGDAGGNIVLVGNSGIRSDFGGAVTLLAPGGAVTLGNTSPPASSNAFPAGVLTQGTGNVDIYAQGSVGLGQSRVFTTFGGNIVIWSAQGDINAGRGSKTTQLVSSTEISYDDFGRVTLTPGIPSSGAGIATLAPVAGTPQGDVDLIAPLGVIDAGEAGIRSSGNANLAALTIVNAANVQVGGKSTGLPVVAVPNVGAISAVGATAAAGAKSAEDASRQEEDDRKKRQLPASTIVVELIGFGE